MKYLPLSAKPCDLPKHSGRIGSPGNPIRLLELRHRSVEPGELALHNLDSPVDSALESWQRTTYTRHELPRK